MLQIMEMTANHKSKMNSGGMYLALNALLLRMFAAIIITIPIAICKNKAQRLST